MSYQNTIGQTTLIYHHCDACGTVYDVGVQHEMCPHRPLTEYASDGEMAFAVMRVSRNVCLVMRPHWVVAVVDKLWVTTNAAGYVVRDSVTDANVTPDWYSSPQEAWHQAAMVLSVAEPERYFPLRAAAEIFEALLDGRWDGIYEMEEVEDSSDSSEEAA